MAVALGHPLAYTLAGVATLFGLIDNGFNVPMLFNMFANNCWGVMDNYVLVAIPLFIFMAQLLTVPRWRKSSSNPSTSCWEA